MGTFIYVDTNTKFANKTKKFSKKVPKSAKSIRTTENRMSDEW